MRCAGRAAAVASPAHGADFPYDDAAPSGCPPFRGLCWCNLIINKALGGVGLPRHCRIRVQVKRRSTTRRRPPSSCRGQVRGTWVVTKCLVIGSANFSAGDLSDLGAMRRHGGQVAHLLDPVEGSMVSGLGFGVVPALGGVILHIGLAAGSPGASASVRMHAGHVATNGNGALVAAGNGSPSAEKSALTASESLLSACRGCGTGRKPPGRGRPAPPGHLRSSL